MNAYLKSVNGCEPAVALGQAVHAFKKRECGDEPIWVAAGEGVELTRETINFYSLRRAHTDCRAGHLMVGRDE